VKIEVIVENARDAMAAEGAGAHRLELVSAMSEGGLTPSYGAIKTVVEAVSIPVYVMLRPHGYHFCYGMKEWEIMGEDIRMIKRLGAGGIVFGCLTEEGQIDEKMLSMVMDAAAGLGITFHRAFDEAVEQEAAYRTLSKYSGAIERILTSGGAAKAEQGIEQLQKLIALKKQYNGPEILVGSGLNVHNIGQIHRLIQADEYHFGSGVRKRHAFKNAVDPKAIRQIAQNLI